MIGSEKYYKDLNLLRLIACVAILLYHFNILKGGYLAVCIFFTLSGYLSCISAFKKEKFSILSYYVNRLLKVYLPLIIIVFITIFVISLFSNINWINLKPETKSVLFGYNNFWQLTANLDYFARHINSPFMHLWYISILLQFDALFPFIYIILCKIGEKTSKVIPCIITILLSIISTLYFYKMSLTQNIMITYYSTFTRIFSLLFGLSLGFIHSYYGILIPKLLKRPLINKMILCIYIFIVICLFIFVDAGSMYFTFAMIIVTLITCRLIDYSTISTKHKLSTIDQLIKSLSNVSYEIYLVQYPIIFIFQYVELKNYLKLPIMLILILTLSYLLYFSINFNNSRKLKKIRYIIFIFISVITLCGGYQYYLAEDHTEEMKKLEEQLEQNEKMIQLKQEEYALQTKQEEENWIATLEALENSEDELKKIVTNLQVVGIGDSVMLGAVENLYKEFPNGYFDAKISRTAWVVDDILLDLKNKNILGNPIILNLGSNGDCNENCKIEIMKICENRHVFWVNTTNDSNVHVNDKLAKLATKYNNLHIIDWEKISSGHPEYFVSDGIHLTGIGREVYTKTIYDAIYQEYLKEYTVKKEETIKQHETELKSKISFYGNNILLNAFDYIQNDFKNAKFIINKDLNFEILKSEIEQSLKDNSLTYKIVFAFDNSISLNLEEYQELISLCKDYEIYILSSNENFINEILKINYENVKIINFYQEIVLNNDYLMVDGIHLSSKGNKALIKILNDTLNV